MLALTRNALPALAVIALVGCQMNAAGNIAVTPKASEKPKPSTTNPAIATRAVELIVKAPASLVAAGAGNIKGVDPEGVAKANGLSLVAAGAGNIVAAGGGNIVAAGGGNLTARVPAFRVQAAAIDTFASVENAVVTFKTLTPAGDWISKKAATTGADGKITFEAVQDTPVMAVAKWKIGDKTYEMTAAVAKGKQTDATLVDPINTFVAGRIRQILADSKCAEADLALDQLKKVWGHFNRLNVALSADDLKDNASLAELDKFYKDKLPLLDAQGQADVKEYMGTLSKCGK